MIGGNTCFHCYRPVQAYIWALHTPMYIFCMHICEFAESVKIFTGNSLVLIIITIIMTIIIILIIIIIITIIIIIIIIIDSYLDHSLLFEGDL